MLATVIFGLPWPRRRGCGSWTEAVFSIVQQIGPGS
jgi:hypothetical protein